MVLTNSWQNIAEGSQTVGYLTATFYIQARLARQDIETNTSYIDVQLYSTKKNSGSGTGYSFECSYCPTVQGDGIWEFKDMVITSNSNQPITHNNDGTKTITLTASCKNNWLGINVNLSGNVDLPTIPREI